MIYYDTETCGFHGPTVLIQHAEGDGPINLHSVWTEEAGKTLRLIEYMMNHAGGVCGFNLAFDHFHLCQTYTTLKLLVQKYDEWIYPEDYINDYAMLEEHARDGKCLKPQSACDLMLHARRTEYQGTMDRSDIRIKRVPTVLAKWICGELNRRVRLPDVYFARYKDSSQRWKVLDIIDDVGDVIPEFKDIVLKFAPSSALKALAEDALGVVSATKFGEVQIHEKFKPREYGYAPFATAKIHHESKSNIVQPRPGNWYGKWPDVIKAHISHWGYNRLARQYAEDDVVYTRGLHRHFGSPQPGDRDSELACMVASVRWRGLKVDLDKMQALRDEKQAVLDTAEVAYNSGAKCKEYLLEVMDNTERLAITVDGKTSTKGVILEEVAKWHVESVCDACLGFGCDACDQEGSIKSDELHPAAIRARNILDARHAKKEIENYDKILIAGRFHVSYKVTGTLSNRMAGADGLNPQGIRRTKEVRSCFPLTWEGMQLDGGDFAAFEVTLMDATWDDPRLREILTTMETCRECNGSGCKDCDFTGESAMKIHGVFGTYFFPPMTYDDIMNSKGLPGDGDKYSRSKSGVFALAYGGEGYTLSNRVGVEESVAEAAFQKFTEDFEGVAESRTRIQNMFCSMRQPGGIGSKVEWATPSDYIESMFGFRRYFTIENMIVETLFNLAENPPDAWKQVRLKVMRRDREQTAVNSVRSALFAAAFALQSANMRAAGNHVIQSAGAEMCKELQVRAWGLQPSGIHSFRIIPANFHDEIMAPILPELSDKLTRIKDDFVVEYKEKVPLLAIDWGTKLSDWSAK